MSSKSSNNKFLGLVAVLLFAVVGIIISGFVKDVFEDMKTSAEGVIKGFVEFLSEPSGSQITLFDGVLWLVVCLVIYFGVGFAFPDGEKIGPLSPMFFLLWIFANLGLVLGYLIWVLMSSDVPIPLTLDLLIDSFYLNLVFSLGPTFAGALGIVNKLK